jgi:hypothetical protein
MRDLSTEAFSKVNLSNRCFASVCVSLMIQGERTLKTVSEKAVLKRF